MGMSSAQGGGRHDSNGSTQRPANAIAAHSVVAALRRHGVEVVFGQSLPSQVLLAAPEFGVRQIGYRTENAGAAMADGYARISHKVGVVAAQNGPAATLLVPGLAEAYKASIPIVVVLQEVSRQDTDKNAFQELDHFELFKGCTKWVRRVVVAERIDDYIDMAFTAAASGRPGPAALLFPYDLLGETAPETSGRETRLGGYPLDRCLADPAQVAEAAALLAEAERPLVVAGGGVHISQAQTVLAGLQEAASLPVATTSMGKGAVDEHHPLSVGVIGYFMGTRAMTKFQRPLVENADVILFVGTRTNQSGTDSWTLFPRHARYIHIDVDGLEVGRNYEALRLVGDAKLTLGALTDALGGHDLAGRQARRPQLEQQIDEARRRHRREAEPMVSSSAQPIRPERLMRDLETVLTPNSIVVTDASYASVWTGNYLRSQRAGMRFLSPRGLAGLGWGLPMALGAKVARPDCPVFCVAGDGGFGHVWAELETARRMGLNVIITILNNQVLAYQKHYEDALFGAHTDVCQFNPVDHASIARACGCNGVRVEDPEEYAAALTDAMSSAIPTLIDVVTDPDAYPPITLFEGRL